MKKYLTCALILCAIPAVAAAQVEVKCEDCTHEVSVYMGKGGFIATADDADMVTWVSTCGGVTVSGELEPKDDGTVAALFTMDNGLACMDEKGGTFQLGPITDGGWFWITDDMNSAVGGLVAKDILKNDMTDITGAGDGVTMMAGKGAVYLKETRSGRVGILPNILPEVPMDPPPMCGAYQKADRTVAQTASGCTLGDGSAMVRMVGPAGGGRTATITNGMVTRNTHGDVMVSVDLWTQGGIVSTTAPVGTGYPGLGLALTLDPAGVNVSVGGFGATLEMALGGDNASPEVSQDAKGNDRVVITIEDATNSTYCTATQSEAAELTIKLKSSQDGVLPPVKALDRAGTNGVAKLTIMCPSASANLGTDLVPDNPFPPSTE